MTSRVKTQLSKTLGDNGGDKTGAGLWGLGDGVRSSQRGGAGRLGLVAGHKGEGTREIFGIGFQWRRFDGAGMSNAVDCMPAESGDAVWGLGKSEQKPVRPS